MALRALGFWKVSDDSGFRHPAEFLDSDGSLEERQKLATYLNAGVAIQWYKGYSYCRFECGIDDAEMGCADLSDGVWVWPEGLSHYVSTHGIRLPASFVDHARASHYRIEPGAVAEPLTEVYDYQFWIDWGDRNSHPSLSFRVKDRMNQCLNFFRGLVWERRSRLALVWRQRGWSLALTLGNE